MVNIKKIKSVFNVIHFKDKDTINTDLIDNLVIKIDLLRYHPFQQFSSLLLYVTKCLALRYH